MNAPDFACFVAKIQGKINFQKINKKVWWINKAGLTFAAPNNITWFRLILFLWDY